MQIYTLKIQMQKNFDGRVQLKSMMAGWKRFGTTLVEEFCIRITNLGKEGLDKEIVNCILMFGIFREKPGRMAAGSVRRAEQNILTSYLELS